MFPNDVAKSLLESEIRLEAMKQAKDEFNRGFAHVMHERLNKQIADFENDLDSEHEIGAYLASFGKETVIQIEGIGYHNPYFVVFYGKTIADDSKVQLVQHVTQINVLFVAIKIKEDRPPRRIGFIDKEE